MFWKKIVVNYLTHYQLLDIYPDEYPTSDINPDIAEAKFGAKSCTLLIVVITIAEWKHVAQVMNARQAFVLSPTNVIPIRKHPGMKCAVIEMIGCLN